MGFRWKALDESVQHPSYRCDAAEKCLGIAIMECADLDGHDQVMFRLRGGSRSDLEEPNRLGPRAFATALRDVRGDGERRPPEL